MNMSSDSPKPERLSPDESHQLATVVAELTAAELPLASGLRAAAEESTSRRLARALKKVAGQLEQGRFLTDVLSDPRQPLPPHMAGVLLAALKSGRMATVLTELFERQQVSRELRRSAWAALLYPLVLIILVQVVYAFASLVILLPMKITLKEFEMRLEPWVQGVLWAGTTGVWILMAALAVSLVSLALLRLLLGAARWHQVMSTLPLFGPVWRWIAVVEATRLLTLLVEYQTPLPAALIHTSEGVSNAHFKKVCARVAVELESGRPLSELLAGTARFPPLFSSLTAWGEAHGTLCEGLAAAGDIYEARARRRIVVLQSLLPQIVFLLIGASVVAFYVAVFAPLFSLVLGLSM